MDNLRRFVLLFSIMFFIGAAVCGYLLALSYGGLAEEYVEIISVDTPTFDPGSQEVAPDTFCDNILFIVGDGSNPETDLLFILNVNTISKSISFMYIPKDMKYGLSTDKKLGNLGSVYHEAYSAGDAKSACEQTSIVVSSFLDMKVSYYINLNKEAFIRVIDAFCSEDKGDKGIFCNIPVDLEYKDEYYDIFLKAGQKYILGKDAYSLISFYKTADNSYNNRMLEYYNGMDVMRIEASFKFMKAFMEQRFITPSIEYYKNNFYALFSPFLKSCPTNITEDMLDVISPVMKSLQNSNIHYYMLSGKDTINNGYYIEYNSTVINLNEENEAIATELSNSVLSKYFFTK